MDLLDKMLKHFFRYLKVRNHTILQRSDRGDITRRSSEHTLGIDSNGCDGLLVIMLANRNDGWLV